MNSNNNLNKNNNYNPLPVKVIYFTKNRIINEKQFFINSTFYSILNYFNKHLKEEGKTKLKKEYIYNEKIINPNEPLLNFIHLNKYSSSSTIETIEISIEIEEIENIGDENIPFFEIIIQPKINPFGLFVYKVKEGIINLQMYPEKISQNYELSKFNEYSSYCNSPGSLFLSGGKINDSPINDFWLINNRKFSIIKIDMPFEKSYHSMIYINLDDNEYIFIIGGENNLSTFYFDIKNYQFQNWRNMNTFHINPTLFQYNNYIYCFNSFNNYDNYFERTDLNIKEHKWEKIYPVFDNNTINFKTLNFGACSCIGGNILFIGGEDIKPKTLIYDPINNFLSFNENGQNEKIKLLSDKYFYKVNKIHNVALPSTLKTKKEIIVVNKMKKTIRIINFNISDGKSKVKFNQDDYGKVLVQTKIHERLRFENQPEIVSGQNLTISNNELNFNEKEILNVELKPDINKSEIYSGKRKIIKKNNYLYLSSSLIYNNLIELIVQNNKDKKNNYINYGNIKYSQKKIDNSNIKNNYSINNQYLDYSKNNNKNESNKILENQIKEENKNVDKNANLKYNKNNDYDYEEEEVEERIIRDEFENTIKEPLGKDIIIIEDYIPNYYNINNFADYKIPK